MILEILAPLTDMEYPLDRSNNWTKRRSLWKFNWIRIKGRMDPMMILEQTRIVRRGLKADFKGRSSGSFIGKVPRYKVRRIPVYWGHRLLDSFWDRIRPGVFTENTTSWIG